MSNDIQVFSNTELGEVRCGKDENGAFMVASDFGAVIGVKYYRDILQRLDDDEKGVATIHTLGGDQQVSIIYEPGIYRALMTSRSEKAKPFQRWASHEVFPSIFKHGAYIAGQENMSREQLVAHALIAAQSMIEEKDARIKQLEPMADYAGKVLNSASLFPITSITKDYGMSAMRLNKILNEQGVQYKVSGQWVLYAKYDDKGYTQSKTHIINDKGDTVIQTYWTQAGRQFIDELMVKLKPRTRQLQLA